MKVTIDILRSVYKPRTRTAITGWIPMHVFETLETEIREAMKGKGLRIHYRGPRVSNGGAFPNRASRTRRCDATHAVIYFA